MKLLTLQSEQGWRVQATIKLRASMYQLGYFKLCNRYPNPNDKELYKYLIRNQNQGSHWGSFIERFTDTPKMWIFFSCSFFFVVFLSSVLSYFTGLPYVVLYPGRTPSRTVLFNAVTCRRMWLFTFTQNQIKFQVQFFRGTSHISRLKSHIWPLANILDSTDRENLHLSSESIGQH